MTPRQYERIKPFLPKFLRQETDIRITRRESFVREYLIIMAIMVSSCLGAVFMYRTIVRLDSGAWVMVVCIASYLLYMAAMVSIAVRYLMYRLYYRPIRQLGKAARKVADGDFSVRIPPSRKDGQTDAMGVLIEDFNKMVEELTTIETLKSDFISNISHEIKTPLSIIQNYATVLRGGTMTQEESDSYLQIISEASHRLSILVSNILRLNKLDSQEILLHKRFSLDEQIRCCILGLDEILDEKQLELDVQLTEAYYDSEEGLLEIVWNNLLTNAIKFTPSGGCIRVNLSDCGKYYQVSVEDTGCGMDEDTRRHIFDRFYQGDTSHKTQGNGLGLSLVKRVLELTGGSVEVDSVLGRGSMFTVMLPK